LVIDTLSVEESRQNRVAEHRFLQRNRPVAAVRNALRRSFNGASCEADHRGVPVEPSRDTLPRSVRHRIGFPSVAVRSLPPAAGVGFAVVCSLPFRQAALVLPGTVRVRL
jgi:hypothetical protein